MACAWTIASSHNPGASPQCRRALGHCRTQCPARLPSGASPPRCFHIGERSLLYPAFRGCRKASDARATAALWDGAYIYSVETAPVRTVHLCKKQDALPLFEGFRGWLRAIFACRLASYQLTVLKVGHIGQKKPAFGGLRKESGGDPSGRSRRLAAVLAIGKSLKSPTRARRSLHLTSLWDTRKWLSISARGTATLQGMQGAT